MNYWMAFVLGLFGSLHCAGMCGPLTLAMPVGGRNAGGFVIGRFMYNGGRIVTYSLIGTVFGVFGKSLVLIGVQRWASIGVGVMLLLGLVVSTRGMIWSPLIRAVEKIKVKMAPLLRQRSLTSLFTLGMLNGLLPCGLVYVAAGASAVTGGVVSGTLSMLFFGLGTLPMLLAIGLSRTMFPPIWRLKLLKAVPLSVFILAALLILRGLALGIPYLSPDLASGSCCHMK
ncbi:MAG TPA: sulfite exporter TauE/SafE family protein [Desulfuromonadaceae bacterium]|nr:sulfite exporter TauE/SafE family protein [Desulfuromonadaceae bacterium]